MRYMLIMRNTAESLRAVEGLDFEQVINAMGAFNESMITAGVLRGGDGLTDAGDGQVVEFTDGDPVVTDGPYGEVRELFNGYWIIEAESKQDALAWAVRAPLTPGQKLEVRRITDASDFTDFADNEFVKKEEGWRAEQEGSSAL
ncbi:YciI family protein [Herbiconiux solani]|uniref:YciI family protein n=1 Tax=Herbiconiux solani TaxID=661329 RepID=UPI000823FAF4|nr:YciI family protein [Herbiconiux solani]